MKKNLIKYCAVIAISTVMICGCSTGNNRGNITSDISTSKVSEEQTAAQKNEYKEESSAEREAIEQPEEKREKYLYKSGFPKKKKEAEKHITPVSLPVTDTDGKDLEAVYPVHKKLADNFQGAFQEMKENGYIFRGDQVVTYSWRTMLDGKRSVHSYGCAVDILADKYSSSKIREIKKIMKKHGLEYVRSEKEQERSEYLHFSYIA